MYPTNLLCSLRSIAANDVYIRGPDTYDPPFIFRATAPSLLSLVLMCQKLMVIEGLTCKSEPTSSAACLGLYLIRPAQQAIPEKGVQSRVVTSIRLYFETTLAFLSGCSY